MRKEDFFAKLGLTPVEKKRREIAYKDLVLCDIDLWKHQFGG